MATLPKYLRPITNVEAHGLTGTEKLVRFVVFVPIMIIFWLPCVALIALTAMYAPEIFMLFMGGIGRIADDPGLYGTQIFYIIAALATLVISFTATRALRRYFLPFG